MCETRRVGGPIAEGNGTENPPLQAAFPLTRVRQAPWPTPRVPRLNCFGVFRQLVRACPGRASPLGYDKHGAAYWVFASDPNPVRVWCGGPGDSMDATLDGRAQTQGGRDKGEGQSEGEGEEGRCERGSWFGTVEAVKALARSMDRRGLRERALSEALWCHAEACTALGLD